MNIAEALTNRSRFGLRATRRAHARARPNAPVTVHTTITIRPTTAQVGIRGIDTHEVVRPADTQIRRARPATPSHSSAQRTPVLTEDQRPSHQKFGPSCHSVFDEDSDRAVTPDLLHTSCISLLNHEKDWQRKAHSASTPKIETLDRHDSYVIKSGQKNVTLQSSDTGNRTPSYRVKGGNVSRYTISDTMHCDCTHLILR